MKMIRNAKKISTHRTHVVTESSSWLLKKICIYTTHTKNARLVPSCTEFLTRSFPPFYKEFAKYFVKLLLSSLGAGTLVQKIHDALEMCASGVGELHEGERGKETERSEWMGGGKEVEGARERVVGESARTRERGGKCEGR